MFLWRCKKLAKDNARTIDAIASEAGFANRSNFYRVFKRAQGISPTDYRLNH
ncbi:MAG: AraC family transcriptional regulator [Muribaculaceae bacterium]|nr:AraC family transcriptional regulator [Muribaculaceae bacterium]